MTLTKPKSVAWHQFRFAGSKFGNTGSKSGYAATNTLQGRPIGLPKLRLPLIPGGVLFVVSPGHVVELEETLRKRESFTALESFSELESDF